MGRIHKQLVGRTVVLPAVIRGIMKDNCEVYYLLYWKGDCEIVSFAVVRGCACGPKAVSAIALPRECQLTSFVRKGEKKW